MTTTCEALACPTCGHVADHIVVLRAVVGIATVSEANARTHWATRARRVHRQRLAVARALLAHQRPARLPPVVRLVRVAPRRLDTDNLASALKAVRDEVAAWLGTSDAATGGVRWIVDQRQGPAAVEIVAYA